MVTNLMALFVLLYAFSELDVQRFQSILTSFQAHAGVFTGGAQVIGDAGSETPAAVTDERVEVARMLRQFVADQGLEGSVEVLPSEDGVTLRFSDQVMFDSGQAELKEGSKQILRSLGSLMTKFPYRIRVEGHTDNVPISNAQFPSNWELSVYRASRVIRFLEDASHVPSERLSAVGYGEYRPVASNTTPGNRRRNRRVDIIVLVDKPAASVSKNSLQPGNISVQ